ncbi:MAG: hypothetical protein KAW41_02675 [Candidatus Diapherotrites archaeon]|nr:hypothetical protein [Candidatus Diapherotrites archaeon]
MDTKVTALLMLAVLVVPAFAISPFDLLLHPGYLIKLVLKTIGLEESTQDKVMNAGPPAEVTPEYKESIDKFNELFGLLQPDAVGLDTGKRVNEFVYIAFTENGVLYADASVLIQQGVVNAFEKGKGNYGTPTIYVRVNKHAVDKIPSLINSPQAIDHLMGLYLDGHIELEPESKAIEYVDKFRA